MTGLPQGWALAPINTFARSRSGNSKLIKGQQAQEPAAGLFPAFSASGQDVWVAHPEHEGNAIIISAVGARCGKTFRATGQWSAVANTHIVWPEEIAVDADWLHLLLNDENFWEKGGSAQPFIKVNATFEREIPLPPLAEQRRIVRKLDTLSARSTTARTHLAAIEKLVERYKLGVLGQLLGKSVADPKPTEHLWAIPSNWSWKKVKDIGDVGLGRQRSPENHDGPFMSPYIRSANITWQGVDISDVKSMNFDPSDFDRFQLKPGDVLLNEGSGSAKEVGKPAIWRDEIPDCCYQNTVLRVQPRECTSEYLYWYFLLTALSEGFVGDTKGVNIQHIGKNGLASFPIPVPPLDEQREIVRHIETAFARIDRLAAEAAKALKLLGHLDQRILVKAFAGALVPQDPTDEPAETLLARIREMRHNGPTRRGRRTKSPSP